MLSGEMNATAVAAGGAIGLAAAAMLATQCTNKTVEEEKPLPRPTEGVPLKGLPPDFDADAAVSSDCHTEIHADVVPGDSRKTIVVVGLSMVGWRFCEALIQNDTAKEYRTPDDLTASPPPPPAHSKG